MGAINRGVVLGLIVNWRRELEVDTSKMLIAIYLSRALLKLIPILSAIRIRIREDLIIGISRLLTIKITKINMDYNGVIGTNYWIFQYTKVTTSTMLLKTIAIEAIVEIKLNLSNGYSYKLL